MNLVMPWHVQPDGKIVVGGSSSPESEGPLGAQDFLLVRYMPDGRLDYSFGDSGKVITILGDEGRRDIILSMALQNDGKIVAGGKSTHVSNSNSGKFALVRYQANGELDASFGNEGKVLSDVGPNGDELYSIALQPDGKIIAAGTTNIFFYINANMVLARYNTDGSLDPSFGKEGIANIVYEEGWSQAESVLLQPDGKIVTAGIVYDSASTFVDLALARCESNGSLDAFFGVNGTQTTDLGGDERGKSLALQSDGKIVLAGQSISNDIYSFALARYNNDVVLPVTFSKVSATNTGNNVMLNWQTVNETNSDYFAIERGATGSSFATISKIKSDNSNNYTYTDGAPLTGNNFYHIKQVDKDGKFTYSKTVSATFAYSLVKLYPNPAKDVLHIAGLNALAVTTLSLFNSEGRIINKISVNASSYDFNLNQLSAGTYYVRVEGNGKVSVNKFVKE